MEHILLIVQKWRLLIVYKLQKEINNQLMQCNNGFEKSICRVFIEKDLAKLGYQLNIYDKVIKKEVE